MLSVTLARKLRDGGLRWEPVPGDRFVVADRGMDDEVFTLAEMTVEVHEIPNDKILGFNGTVEWALDSVRAADTVWLPSEAQLRERLGGAFRRLERTGDEWRVQLEIAGTPVGVTHADPTEAYGLALLHLVTGEESAAVQRLSA